MERPLRKQPYFHIRYTWWDIIDVDAIVAVLEEAFEVTELFVPSSFWEIALFPYHREHYRVEADTLSARISQMRAILYKREWAPLTERDMELRRRIREIYGRNLIAPLPVTRITEPEFEEAVEK